MTTGFSLLMPAYCEGAAGNALLAQPANIVSAILMCVAALVALRFWHKAGTCDSLGLSLIATAGIAGLGAAVMHMTRSPLAVMANILPAAAFMSVAFAVLLRRFMRLSWPWVAAYGAAFTLVLMAMHLVVSRNGYGSGALVVVPLVTLYGLAATLILTARIGMHEDRDLTGMAAIRSDRLYFPQLKMGYALIQTGILFALALVVRAYDQTLCTVFPLGLHFVWHILVALAVFTLLMGFLRYGRVEVDARGGFTPGISSTTPSSM